MGLCVRAGQAVFGEENCRQAIRNGQAALLLMDGDISENTGARFTAQAEQAGIAAARLRPGLLSESIGRPGMVMAVRPGGLADQMISCLEISGQQKS